MAQALAVSPPPVAVSGGELGALVAQFDWSKTPLGPRADWPSSLKTVVRVMLDSRYAMWLGWGPELTFFYNDAYARMTLGPKHPWALGRPARAVWSEIWDDIGPRAESVVRSGQATWDEGLLLFLERRGFAEETYHTFSYSPVPDDLGGIGGMLCVVTEDTERTIGERRLRTLRELAARTTDEARTADEACQAAARILGGNPFDVSFALLYLLDADGIHLKLAGRSGVEPGTALSPADVEIREGECPWPFLDVVLTGRAVDVDLDARPAGVGALTGGAWPEATRQAVVLPMSRPGQSQLAGFVVAGVSPRRPLDDGYRGFLDLLAGQVATTVANARAYEEERRRVEELAELDRAKTAFFSNVSHEFRTPLTLMLGLVEDALARPEATADETRDLLRVVDRNGQRLLRLVNNLLDFSRIEAGRVRASYEPTDLAAYTADLASVFRSACERAGLRLVVDCPAVPGPAFVDRSMWEKVVLNLLSNAFKFTFEGSITVALRPAGRAAELRVTDTGTGIPAHEMPHLFERFHRVENARGRTHEGSGIGLALVQELVRLHGGTVAAESAVGVGTTFRVTVPLGSDHLPADRVMAGRPEPSAASPAFPFVEEALRWLPEGPGGDAPPSHESLPGPTAGGADERPLVLVADDNADMRQYVVRLLSGSYRTEAVADGAAALESARLRPPDLVLTDVMMPRLDGFGLLRALRSDPSTTSVPVLMLSARAGEESRVEGMEAGADDYLVKPFGARELIARVGALLQLARLRREAGESLRRGEERLRLALTSARMVAREYDTLTGRIVVSENAGEVLGLPPGASIDSAEQSFALVHPDDVERYRETFEKAVRDGGGYQAHYRLIRPVDRRVVWLEERGHAVADEAGKPVRVLGVILDVTERKHAEERLKESEARFRQVADTMPQIVWVARPDGHHEYFNRRWYEFTGLTQEQSLGRGWDSPLHPDDRDRAVERWERSLRTGTPYEIEYRFRSAEGDYRWFLGRALPVLDGGKVVLWFGTCTDVEGMKRAETLLRESEARYKAAEQELRASQERLVAALSASDTGTFRWEPRSGTFLEFDDNLKRLFGWAPDRPVRETADFVERVHPDDRPALAAAVEACRLGSDFEMEYRVVLPDGGVRWLYDRGKMVRDDDGRPAYLVGACTDITKRKRVEEALQDADRRKDEFLATLAHELRNPLAPIRNALHLMADGRGDGSDFEGERTMAERQVAHLARLIDDLMDVARISRGKIELRKQRVDLAEVVRQAVETARPQIVERRHTLNVSLPAGAIPVEGDPTRLEQILWNLLNNSAKYTEPGGRIDLLVETDGSSVVARVRDTGIGIPAGSLPHVFDMFVQVEGHSGRSQGGLGIGLGLVKTLVNLHGGTIEAHSAGPGSGSEFAVRLPCPAPKADGPPAPGRPKPGPDVTTLPRRRVLVVDDNVDAANSLARLLSRMYRQDVRVAHDGPSALTIAGEFLPDLVLLDIGLPGMDGYEVARSLRGRSGFERTCIVALTGWGQEEDRKRSRESGLNLHLVKPVAPEAIRDLIIGCPAEVVPESDGR